MARVSDDLSKLIGNPPRVRLNRMANDLSAEILLKLESFNPSQV